MKVKDCMTSNVKWIQPEMTLRDAAALMAEADTGALPVGENDHLVGMITDRDIAIRAIGEGKGPDTPIREIMTRDVKYCFEDETVEHVARNMGEIQVRRLPVMSRDRRLVGIVSLSDIACGGKAKASGEALSEVARPGGLHHTTSETRH